MMPPWVGIEPPLAQPVVDLFQELLAALVDIGAEFLHRLGMHVIVHGETFEPAHVVAAGHVLAERVGMVEKVGTEESDTAVIHFNRHVVTPFRHVSSLVVRFDGACLQQLARQRLFRRVTAV